MHKITIDSNSAQIDKMIYTGEIYHFSPAFSLDLGRLHAEDNAESKSSGQGQFRLDYTRLGRYECEFLDHTYGYRGEGEITLLATPQGPEWATITSIPTGVYHGCAIVILLDKLTQEERTLFEKLDIDLESLIHALDVDQRWLKFLGAEALLLLFEDVYRAHTAQNKALVFLKALEILVWISQYNIDKTVSERSNEFFPAGQVRIVKELHEYILAHHAENISFEHLVSKYSIGYSAFNKIFKAIYGEAPYHYLKRLRINQAAKQLLETDLSILEIAGLVGYSNPSKFSAAFKSTIGILPKEFRKNKNGTEHFKQ